MKRLVLIIFLALLISGCNVKRHIIMPDDVVYTVDARKDDLVSFEKDGVKITVDGRGRPGMIEQALGIMFMSLPDVSVEKAN